MRLPFVAVGLAVVTALAAGCGSAKTAGSGSGGGAGGGGAPPVAPPWLENAQILVSGETTSNDDCLTGICRHSENTDLIVWQGAIYLVHRTAESQILGPNSSLRILEIDGRGQIVHAPGDPPGAAHARHPRPPFLRGG